MAFGDEAPWRTRGGLAKGDMRETGKGQGGTGGRQRGLGEDRGELGTEGLPQRLGDTGKGGKGLKECL